jgi:hypothetical protein
MAISKITLWPLPAIWDSFLISFNDIQRGDSNFVHCCKLTVGAVRIDSWLSLPCTALTYLVPGLVSLCFAKKGSSVQFAIDLDLLLVCMLAITVLKEEIIDISGSAAFVQ